MKATVHIPVLLSEAIEHLHIQHAKTYIDATFGGGGHTQAILAADDKVRVLAIDQNADAIALGRQLQPQFGDRLLLAQGNFAGLVELARAAGIMSVAGILFDLGLSSDLLAGARGFSFHDASDLDMRFDTSTELTAADFINYASLEDLIFTFSTFGQEPYSRTIARAIVDARSRRDIRSGAELASLVERAVFSKQRQEQKHGKHKHPATRIFQALRIVVNGEFQSLSRALEQSLDILEPGGRLVVISYHSLEDRIVKNFLKAKAGKCTCFQPEDLCTCSREKLVRILTPKPVKPSDTEIQNNPRSRSALLRTADKLSVLSP
ncbi:MAG TPA: 16S rRNA (cytosine(1402)-N(4))-methyltransferase RsmH [bacterium]|nr:16S rRNA (cytosine(1402)-N(4))-methyltransferase RsmH [bacterium]